MAPSAVFSGIRQRSGEGVEPEEMFLKFKFLGSHGSDLFVKDGPNAQRCRCTGFLVNDNLMIDAGTMASELSFDDQIRLQYVLISHLHMDHVKELPPLADNLADIAKDPLMVASVPSVLKGLRTHLFNDQVFPDFFHLPTLQHPVLKEFPLVPGQEVWMSGLGVTPVYVNHTVPTLGFIIRDQQSAVVYSGDTYQTEEVWALAAKTPNLKAAFIETSFPDEMMAMAQVSKHLTPALLAQEFKKIGKPDLPLYVYHMKPKFQGKIVEQLKKYNIPNLTVLEEGQELHI